MTIQQLYEQAQKLGVANYEIEVSDGCYFQKLKAKHIDVIEYSEYRAKGVPEGVIRISTV